MFGEGEGAWLLVRLLAVVKICCLALFDVGMFREGAKILGNLAGVNGADLELS